MIMHDDDDNDDDDDDDDVYIMMKCMFVCHEKSSFPTSELSAALGLAGCKPALA